MDCPRNYGSYDIMTKDCEHCKQGKQYQTCRHQGENCLQLACAGWMNNFFDTDKNGEGPHCCNCYKEVKKKLDK